MPRKRRHRDASLEPKRPWSEKTNLPGFSLALKQGKARLRRRLTEAHWPLQDRQNVVITLPEYGKITVDVPRADAFYLVEEHSKKVTRIQP